MPRVCHRDACMSSYRFLVFGATGAIGGAIVEHASARGWQVTGVARTRPTQIAEGVEFLAYDPATATDEAFAALEPFDAVCWSQGANLNDSVSTVDVAKHMEIYQANCVYILSTLQALLRLGKLRAPAKLCVISSIWQNLARQNKLTYCMTKAALQGLVLSASADLAADGHLVNAVLPGALETPMTRKNLAAEQIQKIEAGTLFNRLSSLADVSSAVLYLCSPENTGLTGQFLTADLGYSHVRII